MGGGSVMLALEGRPTLAVTPTLTETQAGSQTSQERWWTSDRRTRDPLHAVGRRALPLAVIGVMR